MMKDGGDPWWISDYHFEQALEFRLATESASSPATANAKTLLLWGGVSPDGELWLDPAFELDLPLELPSASGQYRIEGFGTAGVREFSLDFAMDEFSYGGGGFVFAIPLRTSGEARLSASCSSGAEGRLELNGESNTPMAILRDRATGRIRSILRGEDAMGAAATAAAETAGGAATGTDTRVLVSFGLPGRIPN